MPQPFVPSNFVIPNALDVLAFHLEPLDAHHNDRDHEAWMSSIEWIRSTPGYGPDSEWPVSMSLEANLGDLEMHARDFNNRVGFTYSVLDADEVIGCVYIYPTAEPDFDVSVKTWVRVSRQEMDALVHETVMDWIREHWPFDNPRHAERSAGAR